MWRACGNMNDGRRVWLGSGLTVVCTFYVYSYEPMRIERQRDIYFFDISSYLDLCLPLDPRIPFPLNRPLALPFPSALGFARVSRETRLLRLIDIRYTSGGRRRPGSGPDGTGAGRRGPAPGERPGRRGRENYLSLCLVVDTRPRVTRPRVGRLPLADHPTR